MFDIGWSELLLIIVVCLIILNPKDLPVILKFIKRSLYKLNQIKKEIYSVISDIEEEENSLIDLKGNKQKTYKIDDLNILKKEKKVARKRKSS